MRQLLLLVLLAGCGPTEKSFPKQMGKAVCSYNKKCFANDFNVAYSSLADCIDSAENVWDLNAPGCTFNPKGAACFVRAATKASKSCDSNDLNDIYSCEPVYQCPAGFFDTGIF